MAVRGGGRLRLAALALLPFFLSERYTKRGLEEGRGSASQFISREAADLESLSDRPLLYQAAVANQAGEPERALAALSEAQQRTPIEWSLYFLEAEVLERIDLGQRPARACRGEAIEPAGDELDELEARLDGD